MWLASPRCIEDVSVFLVGDDNIAAALQHVGPLREVVEATVERHLVVSAHGGRHLRFDPASHARGRLAVYNTANAERAMATLDAHLGALAATLVRARVLVSGPRGRRCIAWTWVARTHDRSGGGARSRTVRLAA
jgi:hypothetical protein